MRRRVWRRHRTLGKAELDEVGYADAKKRKKGKKEEKREKRKKKRFRPRRGSNSQPSDLTLP